MKSFISYINRIYRVSLCYPKQEALVWEDLKKLHDTEGWRHGVYEKEKFIETIHTISEEETKSFFYLIHDGNFHCSVKVLESFPAELVQDIFILAEHFNNILSRGRVVVDPESHYVEYQHAREFIVPLLYRDELLIQIMGHYHTSKDIQWAFRRLVEEEEAPAIIIADLIKMNEEKREMEG